MAAEDSDFAAWRTSGDLDALARVFDHAAPKLLLLASHWTKDAASAEDLVQTTFVAAMRDGAQWRAGQPVLAWLAGILGHRATDLRRAQARRPLGPLPEGGGASAQPGPVQAAIDGEVKAQVVAAVEAIAPPYRDVLILRLLHGIEPTAIAHALGRAPATVRKQLERGLEQLRAVLPASVGAALALLLVSGRGLAALRDSVLVAATTQSAAALTATGAALGAKVLGGITLGGITVKKITLLAAVTLVATVVFVWRWQGVPALPAGGPDDAPFVPLTASAGPGDASVTTLDSAPPPPAVRAPTPTPDMLTVRVVVTSRGQPVPGTRLLLEWFEGAGIEGTPAATFPLTCDADGRAVWLGAPTATLRTVRVQSGGGDKLVWSTPMVVAPDERDVELAAGAMHLACALRGTVRSESGTPIPDATVSCNAWHDTRTAADGTYTMRVGTGEDSRPMLAWAVGFAEAMQALDLPEGTTSHTLDITLRPGTRMAGRVLDADGAPVAGAIVSASAALGRLTTDADGRFAWTSVAPGSRQLLDAQAPGRGVGSTMAEGGGPEVDLVLQRGLGLDVRVDDTLGRPVPFAKLARSTARSGVRTEGYTAADGRLHLADLPSGPLDLRVHRRGFATHTVTIHMRPDLPEVRMVLERGRTLRGRVVDHEGQPLVGASVYANLDRNVGLRTAGTSAHTDAAGAFALNDLPAEPCTIHAYQSGWQRGSVSVAGPADVEIVIQLEASAVVAGRVLDARTREPVLGFSLKVSSSTPNATLRGEPRRHTTSDGRWRFTASALSPEQEVRIEVCASGYAPGRATARAMRTSDTDEVLLLLEPGATLTGIVRDASSGEPIAGAEVQLAPPARDPVAAVRTDAAGRFALRDLTPGPVGIEVTKPGYPAATHGPFEARIGGGGAEIQVRLDGGVAVRGQLVGFSGDGMSLWVYRDGSDADSSHFAIGRDGKFELPGLGAGRNMVYFARAGDDVAAWSWTLVVGDRDLDGVALRAREGEGSLHVTVRGTDDGLARVVPTVAGEGPLGPGHRMLRFTGGSFTMDGLPEGPCTVTIEKGERSSKQTVEVRGATTLEIRLQ